jgi:hypothetical protein
MSAVSSDALNEGWSKPILSAKLHVTWSMTMTSLPKPSRAKVQEHRKRLRSQGLRPIQIWVPDVRAPAFRSEARRQARAVAASHSAREDQAFIDAASELGEAGG